MRRLLPETLFAQSVLILLIGIGLSLAAGAWIYAGARQEAVRAIGALATAERIINTARLVDEMPATWRTRLVTGASDPTFRVTLLDKPPALTAAGAAVEPSSLIADYIREALPARQIMVVVASGAGNRPGFGRSGSGRPPWAGSGASVGGESSQAELGHVERGAGARRHGQMQHGPLAGAALSWRGIDAAIEIAEGQWLHITTSVPDTAPQISSRLWLALGVMAGMIALLTAWSVRRMTRPLGVLADAATRLGRNVEAPALAISGTVEMKHAAEAFNEMQARLRRLVDNRTLMLASISHDLRTQLTLLRLRAEAGEPSEDRERMLRTITEMDEMLTATLSFARKDGKSEEQRRVDLGALVASIVDDMADAGLPVRTAEMPQGIVVDCKPVALRRAITNLIDNAVKYGGEAAISLEISPSSLAILVDDKGPGILENQLHQVVQPFFRLEGSRNRETGGIGLGLAIASSIAEAHGGVLGLANRAEGGLRATLSLPR
jgi:signal transduction histidine kinase